METILQWRTHDVERCPHASVLVTVNLSGAKVSFARIVNGLSACGQIEIRGI
jgi:hypothetical protein